LQPKLGIDLFAAGRDLVQLHHRPAMGFIHVLESAVGELRVADQIAHLLVQCGLPSSTLTLASVCFC